MGGRSPRTSFYFSFIFVLTLHLSLTSFWNPLFSFLLLKFFTACIWWSIGSIPNDLIHFNFFLKTQIYSSNFAKRNFQLIWIFGHTFLSFSSTFFTLDFCTIQWTFRMFNLCIFIVAFDQDFHSIQKHYTTYENHDLLQVIVCTTQEYKMHITHFDRWPMSRLTECTHTHV